MNEAAAATQTTEPQTAPAVEESDSIAEHEAQFGHGNGAAPAVDDDDDDVPRIRARSQQAHPGDVEEISTLTKRRTEALKELGLSIERKPNESARVFRLRQDAEIVEALRDSRKPAAAETHTTDLPHQNGNGAQPPTFTEKEPKWEDFASEDDPATAHARAWARYELKRDKFEQQQAQAKADAEASDQRFIAEHNAQRAAHVERAKAFAATHPDYAETVAKADPLGEIPPLLAHTIITDDKSAELMYHLGGHHDFLSEMILLADGKPITSQSVALLRRRLHAQDTNAPTGTLPPASPVARVLPRPPMPVRTGGAVKTESSHPDDDAPLSAHEKAYYRRK